MDPSDCRDRFSSARIARLATVGSSGPHLVPVVFAVAGDRIYTAIDHKPKTSRRLQRLANISRNPTVTLLADHYDEDWSRLWWVRADGAARMIDRSEDMATGLDLLAERYEQYRANRPQGPVIEIAVATWSGWSAARR
jgi:PPOX class probable F420-dependent enzyme